MALLKGKDAKEQNSLLLYKLKEVERVYLTSTSLRKESERLSQEEKKQIQKLQISKLPVSCKELALGIKNKLLELRFIGKVAKNHKNRVIKQFARLVDNRQSLSEEEIQHILNEIQSLISNLEISDLSHENNILRYRQYLEHARQVVKSKYQEGEKAAGLTNYMTIMLQNIFKEIIWDSLDQLKPPPCQFAFLGIGSMAREEMSPYSDVEYAILVEKETEQIQTYFLTLARLIELKIISLGETPYPLLQKGNKSPTLEGFRMDVGGNTPLAELLSLVTTPAKMASYQSPDYFFNQAYFIAVNALRDSCFIEGSRSLYNVYDSKVKEILNKPSQTTFPSTIRILGGKMFGQRLIEIVHPRSNLISTNNDNAKGSLTFSAKDPSKTAFIQYNARETLLLKAAYLENMAILQEEQTLSVGQDYCYFLGKAAVEEFNPDLSSKVLYQRECVMIKRELYRLPNQFVSFLALYYGLEEKNFWARCHQLVSQGKFSKENNELFCSIMEEVVQLRFEAQLYYEEEREEYYLVDKKANAKRLIANADQLKRIKRVYQFLYPLHSLLSIFVKTRLNEIFLQSTKVLQPHNFIEEGKRYLEEGQDMEEAIDSFKKELALEPGQSEVIELLRTCQIFLNAQNEGKRDISQRVKFYKTNYEKLDNLLSQENGLNEVMQFLQRFALILNLKNLQDFSPFLFSPFSSLAAHIDKSLIDKTHLGRHFLFFLIQKLGAELPKEKELEWCYQCVDQFFREKQTLETIDLPDDSLESLKEHLFPENYLFIDCFIDRLTTLLTPSHPQYPPVEAFVDCAEHFLQKGIYVKARAHLTWGLKKVELIESEQQAKLKVKIYYIFSYLELLEKNKEKSREYMEQAAKWARQASYVVEFIEKKQVDLEKALAGDVFTFEGLTDIAIFPKDEQKIAEHFLSEGQSILALPYLEKMLAADPTNEDLKLQVSALRITKIYHEQVCSYIPTMVEGLVNYKDLDHVINYKIPGFLFVPEKTALRKLAQQAPARFAIAYFYAQLFSFRKLFMKRKDFARDMVDALSNRELEDLFSIFGDRLPKSIELEIYLNLACLYSDLQRFSEAEQLLQKALNLHQKHLPHNTHIVSICIELGRAYRNLERLDDAKQFYQRAIEKRQAYNQSDVDEELLFIYDGLSLIAMMEKDFRQEILCFVECARITKELNHDHHTKGFANNFRRLVSALLNNNLWDELLLLIEKVNVYFPDETKKVILALIKEAVKCEEKILRPHLSRFVNICSIKYSNIEETTYIYLSLITLMFNYQQYDKAIQLILQAIELGVEEHFFLRVMLPYYYSEDEFEKAIQLGERNQDRCSQADLFILGLCCQLYAKNLLAKGEKEEEIYFKKAEDYLKKAISFPSFEEKIVNNIKEIAKEHPDKGVIDYLNKFLKAFNQELIKE